ncbi:PQQ-binding-like beta-propeller repeat protein [Streptomyces sp. NPDC014870]|uniref:protein kinase domain-containing protein n=1 Tax=Streptomyces sp. NPDC014870 TaxID=3364925 RepID=UPI0036FC2F8D
MTLRDGDPRTIGGYDLIARLGSGGMGTVYSGRAASGRLVAVKLVHQQFADDPEFRTRFRQEVAAARRVSGAFTAAVVDADPDAERPWMATQLVHGRTLGARVKADGPLRGAELRMLALGLVEALRELHTTGVVHRDLKPDNVLLTDDGPRVIDFGISRAAGQQTLTSTGQILGTPPYMSPEQLSAPARVKASSDVFSLGSVLVFAATGRGPFDADSHYLTAYRVVSEPADIAALTGPLRAVAAACLAKEAAERPGPDELLAALAEIPADDWESPLDGSPTSPVAPRLHEVTGGDGPPTEDAGGPPTGDAGGPPTGPVAHPLPDARAVAERRRRVRRRSLLAVALVASLLAGGGVYLRYFQSPGAPRDDARTPPSQSTTRPPARPATTTTLPAYVATDGGSPTGNRAYADAPARRPAGWRAWNGRPDMGACVYADSSLVCTAPGPEAGSDDVLGRFDAATGEPLWGQLLEDVVEGQSPLVAPGAVAGRHTVIVLGRDGFTAHDLVDGAERWTYPTRKRLRRPVLDADGSRVFAVDASGTVTALETRYGKVLWQRTVSGTGDGPPVLRVAADRVYVQGSQSSGASAHSFVTALDASTGEELPFGTPEDGTRFALPGTCANRGLTLAQDEGPGPAEGESDSGSGDGATFFLCAKEDGTGVLRGEPAWRRTTDIPFAGTTLSGPTSAGLKVYLLAAAPNGEPGFVQLDQKSGAAVWRVPLAKECPGLTRTEAANAVVVTDGLAYVRCRTSGVVIDLVSRKKTGRFTVPDGGVPTGPDGASDFLVVGGLVFTPTTKGWSAVEPTRA